MRAQRVGVGGRLIGGELGFPGQEGGNQHDPVVAADSTSGFVVVWADESPDGETSEIYMQRLREEPGMNP
ncbi:MAG: hypothetical protein HC897_02940 [Thermoanaerobaculia bacterium]|nr:hypothetical protein [Thermoanaerobaculia bacterium]